MRPSRRWDEEEYSLRKEAMKPSRWAIAALTALAAVFYAGCGQRRAASAPPPPAPVVEVVAVIQKDVPIYGEWVGTLEGYVNAQISPQVSGYLIRQDYHEGGLVKKDQVLFEIDPRPFQAVLDQARAQLAEAKAQLAKTSLDVQRDIPEAQARAIPQSQLDNDRQAQLAAKAAVEAGEAALEQASLNLGYTKVRSLISGIAGVATVQVGNLVGPTAVLTSVSQVSPIKVYFPISEQDYLRIAGRLGAGAVDLLSRGASIPLTLTLSDGRTYPYRGRILFANRQVDPQTGTIQIIGAFPNPHDLLRPGQYARVSAMTQILKGALLVPQAAVTELQGGYQVAVVGTGNRVAIRPVKAGQTVGTMWVITSGLKPGERVVAEGAQKVRNGEIVTPKPSAGGSR
jgi:RND family efflux transporter MFP subunit